MYKRILLAYDGTHEGRTALREGALLARRCRAEVFLLSVIAENTGSRIMQGVQGVQGGPLEHEEQTYKEILEDGVTRLRQLGFSPAAKLTRGDPAQEIGAYARDIRADLVVVGYRKQGVLSRWWSGPSGAYLIEFLDCSLLIGRSVMSAEEFELQLRNGQ
jgi:nucleotide-binding universal stress UspA family protein